MSDERALLSEHEISLRLMKLPGWNRAGQHIQRRFQFTDFDALMGFINAIAAVAREQDHHPDVQFGYSACTIAYSTHSAGGLTALDFNAATRVNAL